MAKKKKKKQPAPPLPKKSDESDLSIVHSAFPLKHLYMSTYFYPVLIMAATVIMIWLSWGTWCDPMIDFGRELYIPWQITEGKILYKDIAYFNGPFSPYMNSIWFLLLGVHLRSIYLINFLIFAAILAFSFKLLKELGSKLGATLGCLIIITVFGFAKYHFIGSYNYMAPYSHEMTHGLLLSIIGIWFLSKYQHRNLNRWIFFSGLFLGLIFLTKVEFTIAASISLISGYSLIFWFQKNPWKHNVSKLAVFFFGVAIPVGVAFLLLYAFMPASQALMGIWGSWVGILKPELRNMIFYRQLMGVDTIGMNLKIMFAAFGCLVLIYMPAAAFSFAHYQTTKKRKNIIGATLLTITILASIIWINFLISLGQFMLRPLPLVLSIFTIAEGIRLYFQDQRKHVAVLRITLLMFSLLLLLKILLKADPAQYGFALAMPGTIIMVSALIDWLPMMLEQKGKAGIILRLFSIGMVIVFGGLHVLVSGFWYGKTNIPIKSDTAAFYADFRGAIVQDTIHEIENRTSRKDTLAVLPEGVMLNFLTQRENPTPYINFMPPEFTLFGESTMLDAFQTNPPDYIVLTNKSLKEYGFHEAGIDIGVDLYRWIDTHYKQVKHLELDTDGDFPFTQMRLLQRLQP